MSHTNSTTNYSLPQFVTSDKPAWLTDVNNAYTAIDTGMHNAQTKANTADTNASQALLDASAAATAASAADAKGAGAVASLADTFQTTETYEVGELVIYNSLLYVCSTAVTDPGSWTGSTNWSRVTVEDFVNGKTAEDIPLDDSVSAPATATAIGARALKEWIRIDEKQGSTAINLPETWNELFVICRYGTGGGAQPQMTTGVILPIMLGRSLIIGGGSLFAQVDINALGTQAQMSYFEINGTNYTTTSYFTVYYR